MKIETVLYFGTADIAVPALRALHDLPDCKVAAVCTQPDRPSGRKRKLTPSPVKQAACELGLEVVDPEKIADAGPLLENLQPDLAVVFAYGQYLPSSIFNLPAHGSINFHPSRLPAYRGASPIQSAIADGCKETGLSVLKVSERMDAGDLLAQRRAAIGPEDTAESMTTRFAEMAGEWIPELIHDLRSDAITPEPQNEEAATECGRLRKSDGQVNWQEPAARIENKVRAYQPWPGVFFPLGDEGNLKILEARVETVTGKPGILLEANGDGPLIACGEKALRLITVQPPGKRPMDGRSFLNGHPLQPGTMFCSAEANES